MHSCKHVSFSLSERKLNAYPFSRLTFVSREGTSFAVPINKAKDIVRDLAEGKHINHGYVGVSMASLTPDLARQNNADPNSPNGIIPEVKGVEAVPF